MSERKSILGEVLRYVIPLLLLGAGAAGFMLLLSLKAESNEPPIVREAPLVSTAPLLAYDGALDVEVSGEVSPFREVMLAAEVQGKIIRKTPACEAGVYVEKGELLFQIDDADLRLAAEQFEIEQQQAGDAIDELNREIANAQNLEPILASDVDLQDGEVKRLIKLGSVVSPSEVDRARRTLVAAQNAYQTLQNQASLLAARRSRLEGAQRLAGKRLEQAKLDLERAQVVAPISGVVVAESVEENSYVQKGTSLVAIDDTSAVEVKVRLRMEELSWVLQQESIAESERGRSYQLPQTPASVSLDLNGNTYAWRGVLTRYDGIGLDPQNRTIPCVVLVSEPTAVTVQQNAGNARGPRALVRGMYVNVKIHTRPNAALLQSPERGVRPNGTVWILRDGKVHIRQIKVAGREGTNLLLHAVDADIRPGDKVIVTPLSTVYDGLEVREAA